MVWAVCTENIRSDKKFRLNPGKEPRKYFKYKDYHKIDPYKKWKIQPEYAYNTPTYWKWLIGHYGQELCKEYNMKNANVPPGYDSISWEDARQSLFQTYCLRPDDFDSDKDDEHEDTSETRGDEISISSIEESQSESDASD